LLTMAFHLKALPAKQFRILDPIKWAGGTGLAQMPARRRKRYGMRSGTVEDWQECPPCS